MTARSFTETLSACAVLLALIALGADAVRHLATEPAETMELVSR